MAATKSKKRTSGEQPSPSLDDKRWLTLIMAHHTRSEQLIGKRFSSLASSHLVEGLKSGRLRCMRERRTDPSEREPVSASFWHGLRINAEPDLSLIQILRGLPNQGNPPDLRTQVQGWAFFVWGPDIDSLWPAPRSVRETREMSSGRKPGPQPKHDWPQVVAAELIRRAKAGEKDPTAGAMIKYCEKKFSDEFSPGLKEMQGLLKKLLFGQF
jgi:hypothetical protein